jgi:hypothetical protein
MIDLLIIFWKIYAFKTLYHIIYDNILAKFN